MLLTEQQLELKDTTLCFQSLLAQITLVIWTWMKAGQGVDMNYKAYLPPSLVLQRNSLRREAGNLNEGGGHGMQGTIPPKKGESLALTDVTGRGGEKESAISLILQMGVLCTTAFLVTWPSFGSAVDLRKSLGRD